MKNIKVSYRLLILALSLCLVVSGCAKSNNTDLVSEQSFSSSSEVSDQSEISHISSNQSEFQNSSSSIESESNYSHNSSTMGESSSLPSDIDIKGNNYNHKNDPFYNNKEIYVTWLNCWNGSTESWWSSLSKSTSVNGTKALINGEYVCFDSANPIHREGMARYAREAGIGALAMDLTNGYAGWVKAAKHYQKLCYENNQKFTVAVHPTSIADLEMMCEYVWQTYAGAGIASYSSSYLYKQEKPLIVLYCTREEYLKATQNPDKYRGKFTFVWASGEDSLNNKWGWQLEPQDGPMLSRDSMYITGSLAWNSPKGSSASWRTSLAWLDFNFMARNQMKPQFTIVGSIDDIFERNGWAILDTKNAFYQMPLDPNPNVNVKTGRGMQMRDAHGKINNEIYYQRVSSWIKGTAKPFVYGGIIKDGAYIIKSKSSGKQFGAARPSEYKENDIGGAFYRDKYLQTELESYYWFYHLGNNEYRIVKLTSGLSLQPDATQAVIQEWTSEDESQVWKLQRQDDGSYTIVNKKTLKYLTDDHMIRTRAFAGSSDQMWNLQPVKDRTF